MYREADQYMVQVHSPRETNTLSILRNCRRYMFSMLICLLVKKYTLLRVKIKKHQPGINIWYQYLKIPCRHVSFSLFHHHRRATAKVKVSFFYFLIAKFAYDIKQIWAIFKLWLGWKFIMNTHPLCHTCIINLYFSWNHKNSFQEISGRVNLN